MAWEQPTSINIGKPKNLDDEIQKLKKAGKKLVGVLLPHTGTLTTEFVERTWGPLRFIPMRQDSAYVKITFYSKVPSVAVARNNLAQMALDAGCDFLFWIDSDILFESPSDPNEALEGLLDLMVNDENVDIISGLYRAKKLEGFSYAAWKDMRTDKTKGKPEYMPIASWDRGANWFEVDVTGMGCTLVRRRVFEKVGRPYFKWDDTDGVSEDFWFFEQARKHGSRVFIMSDCKLSHIGTMKVRFDGSHSVLEV